MSKESTTRRTLIADMEFSQPREFVSATGYMPNRNRLDTKIVSLHGSSDRGNHKMSERTPIIDET